jgi:hypothetical protein
MKWRRDNADMVTFPQISKSFYARMMRRVQALRKPPINCAQTPLVSARTLP